MKKLVRALVVVALLAFAVISLTKSSATFYGQCAVSMHGINDDNYAATYWSIKTAQMPRDWDPFLGEVSVQPGDIIQVQYPIAVALNPHADVCLWWIGYFWDGTTMVDYADNLPIGKNVGRWRADIDCSHKKIHLVLIDSAKWSGSGVWVPTS